MTDIKLFRLDNTGATEIHGNSVPLERSLQTLMEKNLEELLGVRFLASEYSTGPKHKGRIDTLGLDENGSPVIIEYKRATNETVINQGLFYLDWLMDHQAEFKLLTIKVLGNEVIESIDWNSPRLLCVAGGFNRYDEHAVMQMNRNIELIRYQKFGEDLLLLELVNATTATENNNPRSKSTAAIEYKTVSETISELSGPLLDLYEQLRAFLIALGDDVQEKTLKYYVAFKRIKNFACVEPHTSKGKITVFIKVNPKTISLEDGFTRDVGVKGHYGTGDLEITLRNSADLEKAKPYIERSYTTN